METKEQKKSKKKNLLLLIAGILGVGAFFDAFSPALTQEVFGEVSGIVAADVYFGTDATSGAILPFIGFILIALGGVCFLLARFGVLDKKAFIIAALVAIVVGVIFVFMTKSCWVAANGELGEELKDYYKLGNGPILGGIFGIVSAILGAVGGLLIKD